MVKAAILAAFVALAPIAAPVFAEPGAAEVQTLAALVSAARQQVGITRVYDPAYVNLDFPGGDVPADRGVCTDVVIRAMREGLGVDLQRAVNRDMRAHFAAYPKIWGLSRTDANIDHRRVPNLIKLLDRLDARLPEGSSFEPGDLVTSTVSGNLPHIMIVSDRDGADGPLVIHNIGRGAREEAALNDWPKTGHFRLDEKVLSRLRALDQ